MKASSKFASLIGLFIVVFFLSSCAQLQELSGQFGGELPLTETEVVNGLKDALEVGAVRAANQASAQGGFLDNELLFIAFPPEARRVANTLRDIGMGSLVDNFVTTLNRSAEDASRQAANIFGNAVREMTIQDAFDILYGDSNAATEYLRRTTSSQLIAAFTPVISTALDNNEATRYWTDITTAYNQLPFVTPVTTDLVEYTTNNAMEGLFTLLEDEERAIRADPVKRTTDILRRVFGHSSLQD